MLIDVLASSDFHGNLPKVETPFDLFLVCGDICPAHDHYVSFQKEWLETEYVDWVKSLPFKDDESMVVMTWGNHDYFGERGSKIDVAALVHACDGKLAVLKNEAFTWWHETDKVEIFGTPYCKLFGSWPFMVSEETLDKKFAKIPEGLDFLITHDSPTLNDLGKIHEGWQPGVQAGNVALDRHIMRAMPKFVFSGHIHSGNHELGSIEGVSMANVSYVDETYSPRWEPLHVKYDTDIKSSI